MEKNLWVATVKPNGQPHLTPVWFVLNDDKLYICIKSTSVKAKNLQANSNVATSLENGTSPVICEGQAKAVAPPWPKAVAAAFEAKYDWNILTDQDYDVLLAISPRKWLRW